MAMRTFVAVSMLASLTLLAPASFARGGGGRGGGGGGHSSGGHASGHSGSFGGSSFGGGSFGAGHATSSGSSFGNGGSSFGASHASSFGSGSHIGTSSSVGHASFRDGGGTSVSGGTSFTHSSAAASAARASYGYANPYAGSTFTSTRPAVMHTVVTHGFNDGHANAPGGPIAVTGRVRGHNPSYTVRAVAVEGGWTPRYHFRVPAMYRGYFTPYVTYVDATYWATDWVITDALVGEEIMMEGPGDVGSPAMDVQVKEELRAEVAADLDGPTETEARADDPRIRAALQSPSHVFLVSRDLAVQNQQGFSCALRAADLVRPLAPASPEDRSVSAVVLAAKGGECAPGERITLTGADLAEFERALLTRVDHARDAVHEGDAAQAPDTSPAATGAGDSL